MKDSDFYTIGFIVNDVVLVSFREKMSYIGIESAEGYFKVKGHDHLGLWLEHPGIEQIEEIDENGKPIPDKDKRRELIEGVFMVPWNNINTILHFPNRDGFDFPNVFKNKIGFVKSS